MQRGVQGVRSAPFAAEITDLKSAGIGAFCLSIAKLLIKANLAPAGDEVFLQLLPCGLLRQAADPDLLNRDSVG